MRVLIVTPFYPPPPGGIQTLTKNLEHGLESLGHSVRVLHVDRDFTKSLKDYIPKFSLDRLRDLPEVPYFNRVYRRTDQEASDFDPDIIHVMSVTCWPALEYGNMRGIGTVVSTHALELAQTRSTKSASRQLDQVHAVSEFTADLTRKEMNINENEITVIPPSITIPDTIPPSNPDGPVFSMSRLVKRKNHQTLIKAWQQLPHNLREKHGLIIAGDGEEREKIKSLAAEDETIKYLGRVSEEKKQNLLRDAACFALTPIRDGFDVEGFGIVFIEAQAHGTPVIGSSPGGVPEAVGDAGLIVRSPSSSTKTADAIETLLTDEVVRDSCYDSIIERIGRYRIEPIAREHLASYNQIID